MRVWIGTIIVLTLARWGWVEGLNIARRLPSDTVPESYVLNVEPNFETPNASFTGHVEISVRVTTNTTVLTLNARGLVLDEIEVTEDKTNKNVGVKSWDYVPDLDQVKIWTDIPILANRKYVVRIWFTGLLRNGGVGFFKSSYTSSTGNKK